MSGQEHTFRVRQLGEMRDFEGAIFTGVTLEGATCGVRAVGRHLGDDVVVVSANAHADMLAALKDVEIFARANKGTMFTKDQEEALATLAEAGRAALAAAEPQPRTEATPESGLTGLEIKMLQRGADGGWIGLSDDMGRRAGEVVALGDLERAGLVCDAPGPFPPGPPSLPPKVITDAGRAAIRKATGEPQS